MKDREKVLKEELCEIFLGQSQRLSMLSKLIIGIIQLSTVSYSKLSLVINPLVKEASNFKRIQRFVKEFKFCQKSYIHFAWHLFSKNEQWVALSIDRTNWKFGKQNINILLIGISYQGTAIPLIWKVLDKRGNSSQEERIELMEELLSILKVEEQSKIKCLLADREFIGSDWISYLKKLPFTFFIRIRNNTHVTKLNRISNIVFLIAIAFCWALITGEHLLEKGHQIIIKKLKNRKVKLYSIFRIGLDRLKVLLLNFLNINDEIKLLSCT